METEYNSKKNILREKTQYMGGIVSNIIYEYRYDNRLNPIEKIRNENSMNISDNRTVSTYENRYDKDGRLIKVVEKYDDGRLIGTTELTYDDEKLIKKEIRYNNDDYKTIDYIYDDKGMLYEETISKNGECSHYYNFTPLEDGRIKKTLLNPARGRYQWEVEYSCDDQSCTVDIHEPILTVDMIKEIMGYIIDKYGEFINCVLINTFNIVLLYQYEDEQIYKYYEDKCGIAILEFF